MPATATPPLEWVDGVVEGVLIDERLGDEWCPEGWFDGRFVDGRFVDEWFVGDGCSDVALHAILEPSDEVALDEVALDEELVLLASLERTIRWAQAEQYRLIESARARHARIEGVGEVSTASQREFATRSFVAELATTLVVPEGTAGRLVADAGRLAGPRAATLDALASGAIGVAHVRSVLEITQTLPTDAAGEVEREGLADAATRTSSGFRRRLHRLRERVHPEPLEVRRTRAVEERRVCLDAAPDGMAWLSLFLEAERAVAVVARLDALAAAADPDRPDPRTKPQRSADIAADLLLTGTLDGADRHLAAATGRVTAQVTVTVPVLSLLGVTDEPAELDGYGPVPADTARRLAAHAPALRRLLVHPETGAVLSYGRTRYRAGADLAGYVRVRDGYCRFPGCARRATRTDLDHTVAWAHGGHTDADNLASLCPPHHRLKHETGWQVTHEPGGILRWTSPAGHVLRTLPERPFTPVPSGQAAGSDPRQRPPGDRDPDTPSAETSPDASATTEPGATTESGVAPESGIATEFDEPDPPWLHAVRAA